MSTNKNALRDRMATAANSRTEPDSKPGQTAIRTKPVRITLDLTPADYEALNRWLASAGTRINPGPGNRLTLSKALRAMIHAVTRDETVALVVLDLLRTQLED